MSLSIGYRPVDPAGLTWIDGGSSFWAIIVSEHGQYPELDSGDVAWLSGVEACGHSGAGELIRAINEYGRISVRGDV